LAHHGRIICYPAIKTIVAAILRFFEIAVVLVRFDHVADSIIDANHSMMRSAAVHRISDCIADCIRLGRRTSSRERLSRSDLCVAKECHILINHQPGRFDVTTQCATRVELTAFSHENIALHRPSHVH
jgi:hypothetical protein